MFLPEKSEVTRITRESADFPGTVWFLCRQYRDMRNKVADN